MKTLASVLFLVVATAAGAEGSAAAAAISGDRFVSSRIDRWSPHIREASVRFGIPEDWIRRVMRVESGDRTMLDGRPIVSHAGAMGLMQLMPGTWAEMRAKHGLGRDPQYPRDNIIAGTAYLRAMYERFGYPGLYAAYNAGPQRYAEHLTMHRRLPAETVAYVAAVAASAPGRSAGPVKQARGAGIFVMLAGISSGHPVAGASRISGSPLFVRLGAAAPAH